MSNQSNAVCYPPPNEDGFQCHTTGSLPDPFDCQKYHFCFDNGTGLVDLPFECAGNTAYDPLTTLCEYTIEDRVCSEGPIDMCRRPGQTGPQLENPNIYYVCIQESGGSLVPWLFRCLPNEVYVDGRCEPKPTTTSTSPTTAVPTTGPVTDPPTDVTTDPPTNVTTDPPTTDPTTNPTLEPTTDPTTNPTLEPTTNPTTDPPLL